MRPLIDIDDFDPLRKTLEFDHYNFCYEEVLTQCYFRTVDFPEFLSMYNLYQIRIQKWYPIHAKSLARVLESFEPETTVDPRNGY